MGRYVRGEGDFEYKYRGASRLCELEYESGVGKTEIFPQIAFCDVADGEDLICHLSGEHDSIPVDENETAFETFRDFFISLKKYFENADTAALLEILEEETGMDDDKALLQQINAAEDVLLSAGCYYTVVREEWPDLLEWINENLEAPPLSIADLADATKIAPAIEELSDTTEDEDLELPLLALLILRDAVSRNLDEYVAHDVNEVWMTPVIQDGEMVTAETEIGEFEDYMF